MERHQGSGELGVTEYQPEGQGGRGRRSEVGGDGCHEPGPIIPDEWHGFYSDWDGNRP